MEIKTGYLYHIKDEFFDKLKKHGLNLFFTNIDEIKNKILEEEKINN